MLEYVCLGKYCAERKKCTKRKLQIAARAGGRANENNYDRDQDVDSHSHH